MNGRSNFVIKRSTGYDDCDFFVGVQAYIVRLMRINIIYVSDINNN
jgi:hypothetical protein